jgi:hypothetical protein
VSDIAANREHRPKRLTQGLKARLRAIEKCPCRPPCGTSGAASGTRRVSADDGVLALGESAALADPGRLLDGEGSKFKTASSGIPRWALHTMKRFPQHWPAGLDKLAFPELIARSIISLIDRS